MGTQFSSRLSEKDAREILERIANAFSKRLVDKAAKRWIDSALKPPKVRGRRKKIEAVPPQPASVAKLTSAQAKEVGDATLSGVISVAESHDFFPALTASDLFVTILEWLLGVKSDASFNGCNTTIRRYHLESSPNPMADLSRGLQELANRTDEGALDPFHGAVMKAAKSVLASVAASSVPFHQQDSPARHLCRKFAALKSKELVTHYVEVFIKAVVDSLLSRADPHQRTGIAQTAIGLVQKTAQRIARRTMDRAEKAGVITKAGKIRDIAVDELKQFGSAPVTPGQP
ncbi:MAG: hypothetical protein LAP86_33075 [Acidobacteriia bacterium]|nr:hypothetical protein [Terriglobia bacterium]